MQTQPIGVCVVVLDGTKKQFLAGRRKNSYKAGMYGIPGGRLEYEESLNDCAARELMEETGLKATVLEYVGSIREKQESCTFIHFVFVCTQFEGVPTVVESDKCEGWEWHALDHIPSDMLSGHAAALDIYIHKLPYKDLL